MNDQEKCQHNDFDEYFEKCNDCGMKLEEMPKDIQRDWFAQFEDGDEPQTKLEQEFSGMLQAIDNENNEEE